MLDVQRDVQKYMDDLKASYWSTDQMLLKLDEESGELAKELFKRHGPFKKPVNNDAQIGEEISDVLFALCCIANKTSVGLERAHIMAESSKSLGALQKSAREDVPAGLAPLKVYASFMSHKGKLADVLLADKLQEQYLLSSLRECTFRMILEANLHTIDLQRAWDAKMNIRYGRDPGRFENKS